MGDVTVAIAGTAAFQAKIKRMIDACRSEDARSIGRAGAQVIVTAAKGIVHVRTGHLRDTIRVEDSDEPGIAQAVAGGINGVDYAADEEYGNSRRPPHPYMRPAVDANRSQARTVMRRRSYTLIKRATE